MRNNSTNSNKSITIFDDRCMCIRKLVSGIDILKSEEKYKSIKINNCSRTTDERTFIHFTCREFLKILKKTCMQIESLCNKTIDKQQQQHRTQLAVSAAGLCYTKKK